MLPQPIGAIASYRLRETVGQRSTTEERRMGEKVFPLPGDYLDVVDRVGPRHQQPPGECTPCKQAGGAECGGIPWWWLLVAAALGGGLGYAAGGKRRQKGRRR